MRKTSYLLLVVVIILLSFSSVFAKPNFVTYLHDVEALQLDDNNPMVNYEGDDFGIGESSLGNNIFRSLLYFDLSSIPSNAILSFATINLVASSDVSTSGTIIYCYRLLVPFSVSEASWDERFFFLLLGIIILLGLLM
ncbi:MAG: hypothetical protein UZ14_CFX002001160 [Chloroflexi bacterium OLB14]|nr:MAG: hypothetical protein UZ14_CFX002001160 [Chloroflexi bacterium OLB14]